MDKPTDGQMAEDMKKKPSRLRMLLHLWGGLCLDVFVIQSGLSKAILHPLKDVGIITLGYFLSYILVKMIDLIDMPKKAKTTIMVLLPIAYFAVAIILIRATRPYPALRPW